MKGVLTLIAAFCCAVSINYAYSQSHFFDVQTLNIKQGLPHRHAFQVKQDHKGYIWISTRGNISRYDGAKFKTYTYSDLNIGENSMTHLALDKRNYLWYCEVGGAERYSGAIDVEKDTIYSMNTISGGLIDADSVRYIGNSSTNPDEIIISCRNGKMYSYEDDFELIYHYPDSLDIRENLMVKAGFDDDYFIFKNKVKNSPKKLLRIKNKKIQHQYKFPDLSNAWLTDCRTDGIIEIFSFVDGYHYFKVENDTLITYPTTFDKEKKADRVFHFHEDYRHTTAR